MPETSADSAKAADDSGHRAAASSPDWWGPPRVFTIIALALATIAVAIAIAAWFRAGHGAPSYSADQTSQAKTNICTAYMTVRQGVVQSTHVTSPKPDDPVGQLAVAANARIALLGGGGYLHDHLAAEPATPADLAKAVTSMSNTIEQLGVNYLAGADSTMQNPLRKDLDGEITQLNGLCK
jgi:hypothetical protein